MFCSYFSLFVLQDQLINKEQIALITYSIVVLILLTSMVILFFMTFQRRKNKLLLEKLENKRKFEREIAKIQSEIQEETLKNVGRELHDNVGQLLSFASMQLNVLSNMASGDVKPKVNDTLMVIKDAIKEVRGLSKSLNNDVISNFGLKKSIQNELSRLNKLDKIKGKLEILGNEKEIITNDSIIIFRIFQEFLSNTIKYSNAQHITVLLDYGDQELNITAQDDGDGFDQHTVENGSGMINMQNRATLINANLTLTSATGDGVTLKLCYPFMLT